MIELLWKPLQGINNSFEKKLQVWLSLGIIGAFFTIGAIVFFQQYQDIKHQLEAQGRVLTENLAYHSEPFIVEHDKDQLNQLLAGLMHNPLVLFSGVINTRFVSPFIDVLKKQDDIDLRFVSSVVTKQKYGNINEPKSIMIKDAAPYGHVIYCITPIISDNQFPHDEATLLFDQ